MQENHDSCEPCSHFGPHLHVSLTGTDSLSCNFTVQYRSSPGQCSVNGRTVLCFDDERQNSPVCKPEKKGNATELCPYLNQSLKDIFQEMMNLESELLESKGKYETECKDRDYK